MASMSDVFISHVEEDSDIALGIALALEEAGYQTWSYEIDSMPGPSYLIQTGRAIEQSKAVLLLISQRSLSSNQLTREVVRAHESGKHFIPVLRDVSHAEFQIRQPEWREAIGAATSTRITQEGVPVTLARVIDGLKTLNIYPASKPDSKRIDLIRNTLSELQSRVVLGKGVEPVHPVILVEKAKGRRKAKPLLIALGSLAVIAIIAVVVIFLSGGFGKEEVILPNPTATPSPTPRATPRIVEEGELILTDSFDDNRNNWNLDTGLDQAYIEEGKLHLVSRVPNQSFKSRPNFTTPTGEFMLEVETKKISGLDNSPYGVIFRVIQDGEEFNFGITGTGYYRVYKYSQSQWESLIPYVYSSAINKGNSINRLAVVCTSSEVRFYVNEHYLESISTGLNMRGGIGLWVDVEGLHVAFDSLSVYQLPN